MELSDLLKFEKFISPVLIKIVYWIVGVIIVIATLVGMVRGNPFSYGAGSSLGGALLTLVGGILALIGWRVTCELMIIAFSANDRLGTLVELKKKELDT